MTRKQCLSFASLSTLLLAAGAQLTACSDDVTQTTGTPTTTTTATTGGSGGTGGEGGIGGEDVGGGGSLPLSGTDTCPGQPFDVGLGDLLELYGDTTEAADDYQSYCGNDPPGSSGADLVYAFTFSEAGTLALNQTSMSGIDPAMYWRTTCADDATTLWCRDVSSTQRVFKQHVEPGTYYLIADGSANTAGLFSLSLDFRAPMCGDGVKNPGEECDDGNADPTDGCDECSLAGGAFESCANPEVVNIASGSTVLSGTSLGNADDETYDHTTCTVGGAAPGSAPANAGGSPDRVYELNPQTSGTMTLTLGFDANNTIAECEIDSLGPACFDRVLHVRHAAGQSGQAACSAVNNQIACDAVGSPPGYTQTISFPVTAGEAYYVFVDSYWNGGANPEFVSGPYHLHVNLSP